MQKQNETQQVVEQPRDSGIVSQRDHAYTTRTWATQRQNIWWDGNGKRSFHACNHVVDLTYNSRTTVGQTISLILRKPSWSSPWELANTEMSPAYTTIGPTKTRKFELSRDPAQARNDAIVALRTRGLPNLMNLPQAIIELKDVPKTVNGIRDIARWLKQFGKDKRRRWLLRNTREVANGYLNAVFGIAPTAHDASDFLGQYPDMFEAEVTRTPNSVPGEPVRAFFRCRSEEAEEALKGSETTWALEQRINSADRTERRVLDAFALGGYGSNGVAAQEGETYTSHWPFGSATAYEVPEVQGVVFGRVLTRSESPWTVGDKIEVNSGLSLTAWELIPFSFVVDWFVNLGKWLRQANRVSEAYQRGYRLESVWLSQRTDTVTYWPYGSRSEMPHITGLDSGGFSYQIQYRKTVNWWMRRLRRNYTRGLWDANPNTLSLPTLDVRGVSDQGAFQWGTGTALAIQACQGL